ncbi:MAG: TetR/AcrR family transcriptional regulator [Xanthomonadales bacterium]|nr:TetR/AcrR family transcriptional regulator [Xanthomonadales bacterium]
MPNTARKRDPVLTRKRILKAAKALLARSDGNLEMAWVSRKAGVSQGLAYHYFGSKEGLLKAVVEDFYDRAESSVLMARMDDRGDWAGRERRRVRSYVDFLLDDPMGAAVITRLAATPAVAAVEARRWDSLITEGSKNIAEGQKRGVVTATQPSELLAAMTLGAMRAAVVSAFTSPEPVDAEKVSQDLWEFVRCGLGIKETAS